jgi:hypothetical protein
VLFGHFDQFPAAGHATRFIEGEAQVVKDVSELLAWTQTEGNKKRRLHAITDYCEIENPRVGRKERASFVS